MIKAIIFDMDGVLIDARDWHYIALNKALEPFGMTIPEDEHKAVFDGLPTKVKLRRLSETKGLTPKLHPLISELKQIYTEQITATNCKPNFVNQFALSRLRAEGYRLAVASNSIRNTVSMMMKSADLLQYLEFYLSNEDVIKSKPAPDIYLKAIEQLALLPKECLIIEDNDNGIAAAMASGAHVLRVQGIQDVNYDHIKRQIMTIDSKE